MYRQKHKNKSKQTLDKQKKTQTETKPKANNVHIPVFSPPLTHKHNLIPATLSIVHCAVCPST